MSATVNSEDVLARRHFRALDELARLDMLVDPQVEAIAWAREQAEMADDVQSGKDALEAEIGDLKELEKQYIEDIERHEKTIKDLEAEAESLATERDGLLDDIRELIPAAQLVDKDLTAKLRALVGEDS